MSVNAWKLEFIDSQKRNELVVLENLGWLAGDVVKWRILGGFATVATELEKNRCRAVPKSIRANRIHDRVAKLIRRNYSEKLIVLCDDLAIFETAEID